MLSQTSENEDQLSILGDEKWGERMRSSGGRKGGRFALSNSAQLKERRTFKNISYLDNLVYKIFENLLYS